MNDIKLMNQTWNAYVSNDKISKLNFSLDEFIEKMKDDNYVNQAIEKIDIQERICSCQYIKIDNETHGFANFFLVKQYNRTEEVDKYYFVYKENFNYSNQNNYQFLPAVSEYKIKSIDIDSLDYLANFSIYIDDNDYVYSVEKRKLMTYKEFLN